MSLSERYFYTNRRAAEWNAEQHGIAVTMSGDPERFTMNPDVIAALESNRYYVHADSFHLLTPQVGDCIYTELTDYHPSNRGKIVSTQVSYIREQAEISMFQNGPVDEYFRSTRIIQRNGIPFMWPQREA